MAKKTKEVEKAKELAQAESLFEAAEVLENEAGEVKTVNLDEDMDKVSPTFATGIQALMRDLIANKGKK